MSQLTSQCAQHWFADSSDVCSGIVILGLVLSLVFAQKDRETDLSNSPMYTWLINVSLYNHQIWRPRFKTSPSPEGPGER